MKKRGLGHLEAVLSISIFIIAVFVIVALFYPRLGNDLDDSDSTDLYNQIKLNTGTDVIYYTIKLNNTKNQISSEASNLISINLSEDLTGKNVTSNYMSEQLKSKIQDENKGIICTNILTNSDLIQIKISKELNNSELLVGDCPPLNEKYYEVSSRIVRKVISEKKLIDLNWSCNNRYHDLKTQLNLNPEKEFAFNIELPGTKISCERTVYKNVEVKALNTKIEVLRLNGSIEYGNINVRIW